MSQISSLLPLVYFLKQQSPFSNYLKEATIHLLQKKKDKIEQVGRRGKGRVSPPAAHWEEPEATSKEILGFYSLKNTVPGFTDGPEVDRLPQISKNTYTRFLKSSQRR